MGEKHNMPRHYDVLVMGGGPAGATLGAILARETELRVAIVEKETFPRDHIGESFSQRVIPVLHRSGVLPKLLASDCWVKKYGGYYAWDYKAPSTTFFDHHGWLEDGVHRWSMHCDRAEFDKLLLDHAKDSGADVFEGHEVLSCSKSGDINSVEVAGFGTLTCRVFVEASGRQTSVVTGARRSHLSEYQNIAIWNHFVDCSPAHSLEYDWNIFREGELSPIANFAFEDGWFWFIPVPKLVNGKRVLTHSIGMVTDPLVLKDPAKRYNEQGALLDKALQVPLLGELVKNAKPIEEKISTATNYSMVSQRFCDYDDSWILLGDSAYFVDPLFSSGVAFAVNEAASAALLVKAAFDSEMSEANKRDLWLDYDHSWHKLSRSFALIIDQWYHAIAQNNPNSVYWGRRVSALNPALLQQTFQSVVDTSVSPDLLHVLTKGTGKMDDLGSDGPLTQAMQQCTAPGVDSNTFISLKPDIHVRESLSLGLGLGEPSDPSFKERVRSFWDKPLELSADESPAPFRSPVACYRFYKKGGSQETQVEFYEPRDGGLALYDTLKERSVRYGTLEKTLTEHQRTLVMKLVAAELVVMRAAQSPQSVHI